MHAETGGHGEKAAHAYQIYIYTFFTDVELTKKIGAVHCQSFISTNITWQVH